MTRVLYLLVWISALKMSSSYNPGLHPIWTWVNQLDDDNWAIRTSSYKYPLASQQLQLAPLHDFGSRYIVKVVPDSINQNAWSRKPQNSGIIYKYNVQNHDRRGQIVDSSMFLSGPAVRARFEPEIPESCRNLTYCEVIPNYPQDEVDKLISEMGRTARFQLDLPPTPDINQRRGSMDENVELCEYEEKVVYPLGAQGADGKWYTLLNNKDHPVQGYRVQICNLSGGSDCSGIAVFKQEYEARCEQKYFYRTVTAVERRHDELRAFDQEVKIPSSCSCVAKHTSA